VLPLKIFLDRIRPVRVMWPRWLPVDAADMAIVSKAEREQAEARRLAAAELFAQNVPHAEIARRFGVTPTAVRIWHKRWLADGVNGLRSKGQPGYPPLLNEQQRSDLVTVLNAGPKASGFDGGWTPSPGWPP
jgi:transposase